MEEELLQQEQEQNTPVEAPEGVSVETSPEENTMAGDAREEAVTEAPVRPVKPLLSVKKKSLLQHTQTSPISKEAASSQSEMAAYAIRNLTGKEQNPAYLEREVRANGVESLRQQAAALDLQQRTGSLQQALNQELENSNMEASVVAERLQSITGQEQNPAALEESAVTEAMTEAVKDSEWLAIYDEDAEKTDRFQTNVEAALMLNNYLESKRAAAEEDFDYGVDFLRGITSLDLLSKVFGFGADFADGIKEFGREYKKASTSQERLQILERFDEQVEQAFILSSVMDTNPDFAYELATLAFDATPDERTTALALGGVEAVLTLFGWGAIAKGGFKGARATVGNKAPQKTVEEAASGDVEAQARILTSRPPQDPTSTEFNAIKADLEKQQRALDDTVQNVTAPVARTEMQQLPVFDKATVGRQETDADGMLISDLVTKKGNPFASARAAQTRATQLELPDGSYEIVDSGAGYVIRYKTGRDAWNAPVAQPQRVGAVRASLDNVDNWVDGAIHAKARMAEGAYSQIEETVRKVWRNGFKGLGAGEKRDLDRVLSSQRKANTDSTINRWWSEDEFVSEFENLTGNTPTLKTVRAFHTFKQLNDFAWTMDNRVLYEEAAQRGYRTVRFKQLKQSVTARPIDSVSDDAKVFDLETQGMWNASDLMGSKKSYDIFEVHTRDRSDLMEEGLLPIDSYRYVAVKKNGAKISDLDPIQLPYKAGGRVNYDKNTVFLKQLNLKKSGSSDIRLRDKTMYRADSMAEAKDYASRWNKAREVAKDVLSGGAEVSAVRASFRDLDLGELDDFLQNAKAYGWDLDQPMVPVFNRQNIPYVNKQGGVDNTDELDYIVEGVGNRFSKRGQGVPHILGEAGEGPLDPIASLADSIDLTARNSAFSSFRMAALELFEARFGRYLEVSPSTPITAYLRASPNKAARDAGLIGTIKGHQRYLQDVMSMKFQDERYWDVMVAKAADWAYSGAKGDIGKTLARGAESARGIDPTAQARNIIFNAKMGFFNPATFILQAAQAPIVAATVPKFGMRSLAAYPLFRAALYGTDEFNPAVARAFAEKAGKLKEMDFVGDLDEAVREFRRMGISNFGGRMAYIDANSGNNVLGLARSSLGEKSGNLMDKGRVFFNEGEMVPRATSYLAARAKWLSDETVNPKKLPATSDAGREWIHNATNKYILGMSRADIQQGLRGGVQGVIAQFYSFVFRATAAFTGRQFTKTEKMRMATAYVLLYGGAGIPFAGWALRSLGTAVGSEELSQFAERGFVDGVMSAALGYETNMSSRAGIGQAWDDIWDMVTGDKNVMEVLGGAAGGTGSKYFDSIGDMMRAFSVMTHPDLGTITERTVIATAQQVTTFSNAYRMAQYWGTGKLLSGGGTALMPITNQELVGQFFGVPTFKYEELDLLFTDSAKRKQVVKDGVEDILTLMRERADANSSEEKQRIDALLSLRSNNLRELGLLEDVQGRVMEQMQGSTMYSEMFRRSVTNAMEAKDDRLTSPALTKERFLETEAELRNKEE